MPAFIAVLLGGLVTATGSIVGRVLIALSIGYVAYSGLGVLLDGVLSQAVATIQGLPGQGVRLASVLKLDVCLNIILSSYSARLVLMGLQSGTVTRMIVK